MSQTITLGRQVLGLAVVFLSTDSKKPPHLLLLSLLIPAFPCALLSLPLAPGLAQTDRLLIY